MTQPLDNVVPISQAALNKEKRQYDNAGRVVKTGRFTYHYDECGRLIEKTETKKGFRPQQTRYQWNADDQLVQVDLPNGERWRYHYDPFSRRIRKTCTVSGQEQEQRYQWYGDLLIQSLQVLNGEVQRQTEYAYEPGSFRPVAQITQQNEQSRLHYIVTDMTGSARELVNEQGQIVWRGYQEVWGNAHQQPINLDPKYAANDSLHDPIECDLGYPGQIFDKETGLYYNRHRYYDAYTGQYLSPDPIGMAGGLRPQAYVHNPVDWVDPLGLATSACQKLGGYEVHDVDSHGNLSPGSNRAPGNLNKASDNRVQSHHPIQQEWAKRNVPGYNPQEAPAILLPSSSGNSHAKISAMQRGYRREYGYNTSIRSEFHEAAKQMREAKVPESSVRKQK